MSLKTLLLLCTLLISAAGYAQQPEVKASPEVRAKARARAEYSSFRRQINALKEFAEERKKLPLIEKERKEKITLAAVIDSVETDDTATKTLTGYIAQQTADASYNVYEITFERATKHITAVKKTGEGLEPEEEKKAKPTAKKPTTTAPAKATTTTAKKKTSGDEDEDSEAEEEEEKEPAPAKTKAKAPAKEKDKDEEE